MPNVIVDKDKIDLLANAISDKSGEPVTMTLDDMVEAVDSIETPNLQNKTIIYNASDAQITDTITADDPYTGLDEVNVIVEPVSSGLVVGRTGTAYASSAGVTSYPSGGVQYTRVYLYNLGTTPFVYKSGFVRSVASSTMNAYADIGYRYDPTPTASGATVTIPQGFYSANTTATVASGTEGTPTATKGTVTNNSVTVTPSVTNSEGYIDGGSHTGTPVTVTASELVNGTYTVSGSGSADVTNYASISVPTGSIGNQAWSNNRDTAGKLSVKHTVSKTQGFISGGYQEFNDPMFTLESRSVTPSTTQQTITPTSDWYYLDSVTVNAIPTGTAGTPSATKGAVSNHSVTVTPSVTNQTGWITGSTITGNGVSVTASELVSGNLEITQNGTGIDVSNYSTVSVSVSGGGGSGMQVGIISQPTSISSGIITFTGLQGEPTSFVIERTGSGTLSPSATQTLVTVVYDGTNTWGQKITNTSNAQVSYTGDEVYFNYGSGTLEVVSVNPSTFDTDNPYTLTYTYGGTSANIGTQQVQVGSGATSITFTNLEDEPEYFSCSFLGNFGTSSGYQRVISVVYDGSSIYGLEMDSGAHYSTAHWSYSYNNGSLTISSQGTNAGGYFHQPSSYQLTYGIGGDQSLQTKTVTPTTSTQNVTADTGYTALKKVVVNPIPSSYVQPTATQGATTYRASTSQQTIASGTYLSGTQTIAPVSQTNLSAENIKQGTTISISNGLSNIWSVTGTYSGGGGGSSSIGTATVSNSSNTATSISFTNLSGRPIAFFLRCQTQIQSSGSTSYYYVDNMRYNGTNTQGTYVRIGSTRGIYPDTTHYSYTYTGTTLTVSSSGSRTGAGGSFYNGTYELTYIY